MKLDKKTNNSIDEKLNYIIDKIEENKIEVNHRLNIIENDVKQIKMCPIISYELKTIY